jgi:hypothetical protein
MKFIEIILENSKIKEAKLFSAAKKAANNPETGITIQNKSAYHVIKDCANITMKYLPHYVFANYECFFTELSGKFKRKDIEEFVSGAEKDIVLNQLLILILELNGGFVEETPKVSVSDNNDLEIGDPYGDYGVGFEEQPNKNNTDTNLSIVDSLCKLFDVV